MADGMCGPSNPLQNFQKQSTVDRTLQQDRLVSRASPSQGFRSSPGPNSGLLNPEFEAFQAGQLPLDRGFQHQQFPSQPGFNQQPQPGPSVAWASDFQRLNISSPPPQFQQQQPFAPQQAQQRHDTGGWHQDFARQQGGMAGHSMGQMPGQTNSPYQYSPMSGMGMAPQYSGAFVGQQDMSIAQQKQPEEAFDEEAFARAFEAAAQAEMASKEEESQQAASQQETSQEQNQGVEMGQDILINESAERLMATSEGPLNQERIGADTIEDPRLDPKIAEAQNNPDALARTAGQLLDSVRHDRSTKFQNSQFLELMRQFRDKEATVQGDQIVGTGMNNDNGVNGEFDGMAGISGTVGEEAIKEEIALLFERLRKIALDQENPFERTPQNLRILLHTLIRLHLLLPDTKSSPLYNMPPDLSSTLSSISTHPLLSQIPSVQEIITSIRHMRTKPRGGSALWFSRRRQAKIIAKADEGVQFSDTGMGEEEDVVGRWLRDHFVGQNEEEKERGKVGERWAQIRRNAIERFAQRGQSLQLGDEAEETIEARVARIKARVAELTGNVEAPAPVASTKGDEESEAKAMWGVLGYTSTQTGNEELDRHIMEIHRRRMEDILGEHALSVKSICEEKGIWRKELETNEFQLLQTCFAVQGGEAPSSVIWQYIEQRVRRKNAGESLGDLDEEAKTRVEAQLRAGELGKIGVTFRFPSVLSAEDALRRAWEKTEFFGEGSLKAMQEKTVSDPSARERFIARRAGKQALGGPEEMRDMAEESVERVKTRED